MDTVEQLMKSPAVTVPPDLMLTEVVRLMRSRSIGSVLVIHQGRLCGIFTDKDVIRCISQTTFEHLVHPIREFMTPDPLTIQASETHDKAISLMKKYNIRHLPVFRGDVLVGVVSIRDLVKTADDAPAPYDTPQPEVTESASPKAKELTGFQMRNISLLAHLYRHDAVTDEVVENLRESELDYFSIVEKCHYLEQRVNIDEKTGLLKYKSDYLLAILKTASRLLSGFIEEYPVSFVRFDIDDFSLFNNKYGHDVGDRVLVRFSQFLKDHSRPTDYIIRFGGEEFDVILPNTRQEGLVRFLQKLYQSMAELTVEYGKETLKITVSAGATTLLYNLKSRVVSQDTIQNVFEHVQNEADNALYDSKFNGKNRFSLFDASKINEYPVIRKKYTRSK